MALSSAFSRPTSQGRAEHDWGRLVSVRLWRCHRFFSRRERPECVGVFQSRGIPDNENE
jgi:hypothetical protein